MRKIVIMGDTSVTSVDGIQQVIQPLNVSTEKYIAQSWFCLQ